MTASSLLFKPFVVFLPRTRAQQNAGDPNSTLSMVGISGGCATPPTVVIPLPMAKTDADDDAPIIIRTRADAPPPLCPEIGERTCDAALLAAARCAEALAGGRRHDFVSQWAQQCGSWRDAPKSTPKEAGLLRIACDLALRKLLEEQDEVCVGEALATEFVEYSGMLASLGLSEPPCSVARAARISADSQGFVRLETAGAAAPVRAFALVLDGNPVFAKSRSPDARKTDAEYRQAVRVKVAPGLHTLRAIFSFDGLLDTPGGRRQASPITAHEACVFLAKKGPHTLRAVITSKDLRHPWVRVEVVE
jgi:hypothetical protein